MTFLASFWWLWLVMFVAGVMVLRVSLVRIGKNLRANGVAGGAFYYTPRFPVSRISLLAVGALLFLMATIVLLGLSLIGMVVT